MQHTTPRKQKDVPLADQDLTLQWVAQKVQAASREMIVREDRITFRTIEIALLRAGLAMGLVVMAAGCQQKYWYQEGKTFDECKADHEDCWAELRRRWNLRYPSSYTHEFLEDCMRQRGYDLMTQKDLPLDVKRETPDAPSDVPWYYAYGVAGAVKAWSPPLPPDGAPEESATLAGR